MMEETNKSEEIVLDTKMGDYWSGNIFASQISGNYTFTSERIKFEGRLGTITFNLPYADIASAVLCNVGGLIKFLPTGILITMKDGKTYRFSLMKRKKFLELIQSRL